MKEQIMRGDVFYACLNKGVGSEQTGNRPVVVIQNDVGNRFSSTVIVAAITGKIKKKSILPTHCVIQESGILTLPSIVLAEQITTIDKGRLKEYLGHLDVRDMQEVDKVLAVSIGLKAIGS